MIHCINVVKRDLFVQNKAYFSTLTLVFRYLLKKIIKYINFISNYQNHILVCKYRPGCTCLKQLQFTPYVFWSCVRAARRGSRNFRQGGGVQLSGNFDKQKKKKKNKKGKKGGGGGLWLFSFNFPDNYLHTSLFSGGGGGVGVGVAAGHGMSLSTQIHRCHGRFDFVNVFGMGVWRSSPRKFPA